jgi:hypothetical protein
MSKKVQSFLFFILRRFPDFSFKGERGKGKGKREKGFLKRGTMGQGKFKI